MIFVIHNLTTMGLIKAMVDISQVFFLQQGNLDFHGRVWLCGQLHGGFDVESRDGGEFEFLQKRQENDLHLCQGKLVSDANTRSDRKWKKRVGFYDVI